MSNRYSKKKKFPKGKLIPENQKISFALYDPFLENSPFRESTSQSTKLANSSLSNIGSINDSPSKKRTQSKMSYGQKKKSRTKNSPANDEQNLDSDLFALVQNLPTQNSDSNSSRDTIILTDGETDASSTDNSENKSLSLSQFANSTFTFPSLISSSNLKNSTISNLRFSAEKNKKEVFPSTSMFESKPSASDLLVSSNQKSSFLSSSSCQTPKYPAVKQSIYAEMGLDEDLCDVKAPKFDSKQKPSNSLPLGHLVSPVNSNSNVQIKKEPEDQANGVHVSMTFEADPYDMDDEMPLSFLKINPKEECSSESRNSANKNTNCTPTTIKTELVDENEIPDLNSVPSEGVHIPKVSEGTDFSHKFLQLPLKIKTEPILDGYSESLNSSMSKISNNSLVQVTDTTNVPKNNAPPRKSVPSSVGDQDTSKKSKWDGPSIKNPLDARETVHGNVNLNQPSTNSMDVITRKKPGKGKKKGKQSKTSNLTPFENDPTTDTASNKTEEASSITLVIKKTKATSGAVDSNSFRCTNLPKSAMQDSEGACEKQLAGSGETQPSNASLVSSDFEENSELAQIQKFLIMESTKSYEETSNQQKKASEKGVKGGKKGAKQNKGVGKNNSMFREENIQNIEAIDSENNYQNSQVLPSSQPSENDNTELASVFAQTDTANSAQGSVLINEHKSPSHKVPVKKEPVDIFNSTCAELAAHLRAAVEASVVAKVKREPQTDDSLENLQRTPKKSACVDSPHSPNLSVTSERSSFSNFTKETPTDSPTMSTTSESVGTPLNSSNKSTTKKKRRRVNNNWYKKKKVKRYANPFVSQTLSDSEDTISAFDSDNSSIHSIPQNSVNVDECGVSQSTDSDSKSVFQKKPVVVIRSLATNIDNPSVTLPYQPQELADCARKDSILDDEMEESGSKPSNQSSEEVSAAEVEVALDPLNNDTKVTKKIATPRKGKRKRRGSSNRKRKKPTGGAKSQQVQFESIPIPYICPKTLSSPISQPDEQSMKVCPTPNAICTDINSTVKLSKKYPDMEKAATVKTPATITIEDSPSKTPKNCEEPLWTPILNTASIYKEIAGIENYVAAKGLSKQLPCAKILDNSEDTNKDLPTNNVSKKSGQNSKSECGIYSSTLPLTNIKKEKELNISSSDSNSLAISTAPMENLSQLKKLRTTTVSSESEQLRIKKEKLNEIVDSISKTLKEVNTKNKQPDSSHVPELFSESAERPTVPDHDGLSKLSVRKEACEGTYSKSFSSIKNISDLIEKTSANPILAESQSSTISLSNISKLNNQCMTEESDDEIQILAIGKEEQTNNVECVDLTEEPMPVEDRANKSNSSKELESFQSSESNSEIFDGSNLAIFDKSSDQNKAYSKFNYSSNDLLSHIIDEDTDAANEKKSVDIASIKQKYLYEYFTHPYPPSVSFLHKQRNNKMYARTTSQTLNLSIKTVESRLKATENVKNQLGNKLSDIVKLDIYPVSNSEVECYHRILGVAPSQKLLSKCFKPTEKKLESNNPLNLDQSSMPLDVSNSFQDRPRNLLDVIQAMSANRPRIDSFEMQEDSILLRNNLCPVDTAKNSFESSSENNDLSYCQSTNDLNELNESTDLYSNARCASFESNNSFLNSDQSNNLVGSETNFIGCESQSIQHPLSQMFSDSEVRTNDVHFVNSSEAGNVSTLYQYSNNIQVPSLSSTCFDNPNEVNHPSTVVSCKSNDLQKSSHEGIDWDAIRNIVNVIKVVGVDVTNNETVENQTQTAQEAFDNHHSRKFTITQPHPQEHVDSINANCDPSTVCASPDQSSKHLQSDDDDYVDNEPMNTSNNDSDIEERSDQETEVESTNEVQSKPKVYKSKWEKIMERKALENSDKKDINEHLLKDCFPVSSKVPSKKMNTLGKHADNHSSKSSDTEESCEDFSDFKKPAFVSKLKKKDKAVPRADLKPNSDKDRRIKKKPTVDKERNDLFTPDQVIKPTTDKKAGKSNNTDSKTSEKKKNLKAESNQAKKFYGNRVTNRGQFLTESSSYLKNIKIPKKVPKGNSNMPSTSSRSDEYHSLVDSPSLDLCSKNSAKDSAARSTYYDSYNKRRVQLKKKISSLCTPQNSRYNSENSKKSYSTKSSAEENFVRSSLSVDVHPNETRGYKEHLEMPKRPLLEAPKQPLLEAPKRPLLEAPKQPLLENPKWSLLETPQSYIMQSTQQLQNVPSTYMHQNKEFMDLRSSNFSTHQFSSNTPSGSGCSELQPDYATLSAALKTSASNQMKEQMIRDERTEALYNAIHSLLTEAPAFSNSNFTSGEQKDLANRDSLVTAFQHSYAENTGLRTGASALAYAFPNATLSATAYPNVPQSATAFSSVPSSATAFLGVSPTSTAFLGASSSSTAFPYASLSSAAFPIVSPSSMAFPSASTSSTTFPGASPSSTTFSGASPSSTTFLGASTPSSAIPGVSPSSSSFLPSALNPPHQSPSSSGSFQEKEKDCSVGADSTFLHPASLPNNLVTSTTAASVCLVPTHLKTLVGQQIMNSTDVQLIMLEWSVEWLVQQQKFRDPPPISNSLRKVASCYESFESYYNTYFPLLMLDTWHRLYTSWTHLHQSPHYFCDILSYSVKNTHVIVECQTIFNTASHGKTLFPDEGSMLMVRYGTKAKDFSIKILGYVTHVKTRRFNPVTDSKLGGFKPPRDGNFEALQVISLAFMGAYNSEDIDKHLPVRIQVLCNVKATLKQNDALINIEKSPLLYSILNPIEGGLISVTLIPRNSTPEKVDDCVRSITKGILSPHPLPLLTIVKALPESDRLNIIPLLIDKMKSVYRTKVLLCVRTIRALSDIAANICLHKDLKMVIMCKKCDTNPQFQKYLLDELVTVQRNSVDTSWESLHAKSEAIIKTKKQIFHNSDVILCMVRNCHDDFMQQAFIENESVAQMCCIVDEANLCTEPETLIPTIYGISKLILIGNPDYPAKVVSKTAISFRYDRSLFHRAYDLDLCTE